MCLFNPSQTQPSRLELEELQVSIEDESCVIYKSASWISVLAVKKTKQKNMGFYIKDNNYKRTQSRANIYRWHLSVCVCARLYRALNAWTFHSTFKVHIFTDLSRIILVKVSSFSNSPSLFTLCLPLSPTLLVFPSHCLFPLLCLIRVIQ